MKKSLILVLLSLFLLSGCNFWGSSQAPPEPKPTPPPQQAPGEEQKGFVIGQEESPIQGLDQWINKHVRYEGIFLQKQGEYRSLLLTSGEKFAQGYEVQVKEVRNQDNKWLILASYNPVEEGAIPMGEAFVSSQVVSILADNKPIEVQIEGQEGAANIIEIPEGRELATSNNFLVISPLPGDKVNRSLRVVGKARVFEATFRIHVEDGHVYLAEKIVMADSGGPDWGNFDVTLDLEEPTSPNGTIILSYENMENGNMVEELQLPISFDNN